MYTLLKNVSIRDALITELPALAVSIVVAELLYKFHSFTLECLAFLVTWAVVSFVFAGVTHLLGWRASSTN